jgi:hypothetical protein
VAFLTLCLLPFVGMLWVSDTPASDDDSRHSLPELKTEIGLLNLSYLADLGDYFEDHFAYRNLAIDINAHLRADLLRTSSTDQVIIGRQGWLFYGGTLDDYLASDPLSNRELSNIAHNLALMQGYTNAMGADFLVTIAPNKNSLYPNYMPFYYINGNNESMTLLAQRLRDNSVHYVDLFELFANTSDELYLKTDTHWTCGGALLAANALLQAAGMNEAVVSGAPSEAGVTGDIERMLYPVTPKPEKTSLLSTGTWEFTGAFDNVEDDTFTTTSPAPTGTLLMYRDSFANSLIPYLAPEFSQAEFSKLIPYNLTRVADLKPDVVIIERAERHVRLFGFDPPLMYAPTTALKLGETLETKSWVQWHQDGDFRVIEGCVDEEFIDENDSIYLSVEGSAGMPNIYVPFEISIAPNSDTMLDVGSNSSLSEYGFRLFLDEHTLTEGDYTIRVLVLKPQGKVATVVATMALKK